MKFTQLSHESEMFYIRPYKDVKYPQHKYHSLNAQLCTLT